MGRDGPETRAVGGGERLRFHLFTILWKRRLKHLMSSISGW